MDPEIAYQIRQAFEIEGTGAARIAPTEKQRALERANQAGRNDAFAPSLLSKALVPIVDRRAGELVEAIKRVIEAHGVALSASDRRQLADQYNVRVSTRCGEAELAVNQLKTPNVRQLIDTTSQELEAIRVRRLHEFEVVLAALKTEVEKQKPYQQISVTNSQNVLVGDHGVQVNYSTIFRDLVTKIESADASPEEKATAKGHLAKFLEHPIVASVVGAVTTAALSPGP